MRGDRTCLLLCLGTTAPSCPPAPGQLEADRHRPREHEVLLARARLNWAYTLPCEITNSCSHEI
jgi:hypothetical protein